MVRQYTLHLNAYGLSVGTRRQAHFDTVRSGLSALEFGRSYALDGEQFGAQ
jgi:hypothetical protein